MLSVAHKASRTAGTSVSWTMQLCKNLPYCLPPTLTPHLLQQTWFPHGEKGGWLVRYCSWSPWEGCYSLSQNASPILRSILASQFPGDRNQPALPGNHSSPSLPAEMSRDPGAQSGSADASAPPTSGPLGPGGKQVQIDCP